MRNEFRWFFVVSLLSSILASKYEIEMQSFKVLPELTNTNYVDPKTLRMKQDGRNNFVISGSVFIKESFGPKDKVKMTYEAKFPNGRFMKMYVGSYSACEMMKQDMYKKVSEKSNVPYPPVCPFPPGNYTIDNLNFDETFYPSVLPTGENRITIETLVDNVSVYGVQIETNIKVV